MNIRNYNILPQTEEYLKELGENIRLARKRRNLTSFIVSQRAGISRQTLSKIERGNPSVSIGYYASVLHALNGLDKDISLVGKADTLGRQLQDSKL